MTYIARILSLCLFLLGTINSKIRRMIPTHQILFIGKKGVSVTMLQKGFKAEKGKKPAIYVDLHDVIAIKNLSAGIKTFTKKELISGVAKAKFVGRALKTVVNPVAMAKMIKLGLRKNKVTESYFNVIKNHSSKKLHKQCITFATEIYEPNTQLINLLYRLKASGCRIYLFSNGGYATIQELKNDIRFKHLFEGPDPLFTDNCINSSYEDVYTVAKPSPIAFETALQKYGETAENSIFIDNTREKLCDWRNKIIQEKYPEFTNFWACSLLYHVDNHAEFERTLQKLNIL